MTPRPAPLLLPPPDAAPAAGLLDALRAGDAAALQALVDLLWRPLLAYAGRLLRCDDAAEDVVQRAFIRLWERRDRWEAGSDARRILYTVVRHLALNQLDSDRARTRREPARREPPAPVATPAQLLDERELARALDRALDDLPPRRREALVLARFHHMTHAEIAAVMGLTPRTVTNHVTTALAELEVAVGRYLTA